jgi:hypothetical protein
MAAAAWPVDAADEMLVTLTVEDEAGVGRVNEPITMGVPLPEGKVTATTQLYLTDAAGKRIPAQVTAVAKWLDGKHVKWVHVTWNQSVPAKGKAQVRVMFREQAPATLPPPLPAIIAAEKDGLVAVQNDYVRFVVRGARFDGFHKAWFDATGNRQFTDANLVIDGANGGSHVVNAPKDAVTLENEHPKVTGATTKHSSTNDATGRVEIEESGSRRVVVKATGRHVGEGGHVLDYIVRFYAYADSPVVRVSHTFVSKQGNSPADFHWMAGLHLDAPTKLGGGKVTIGTEKAPVSCAAPGSIHQVNSDRYEVAGTMSEVPIAGKGKSTKPLTTGWIDVTKGDLGLAAGIKWFWQMRPKKLSVNKDGLLSVGLYPLGSRPLEVYMGQSRTHFVTFLFHDGKTGAKRLNDFFGGVQKPLLAWAPGKYYCRDTHCLGYAIENNKELFGDDWPQVERWNKVQLDSINMLLGKRDGNTYGPKDHRVTRDSYGVYAFGDRYHWAWGSFGKSPVHSHQWRQSWAGNYYDYSNAMLMAFLRTGEKTFLEWYWPSAWFNGDVHHVQYHPRKELVGACRYCPPRNFVAVDNGTPYISREYNHWKSQSTFALWYLTANRRALDHCRNLMNNAYANHAADSGWAARGIGAQIIGLWNAYELTLDKKYFERMKGMAYRAMRQFKRGKYSKGGKFMWGIANEGLCHYYWVSGDPKVIETLKSGLDKYGGRTNYANGALALAMMYRVTGEKQYADWAWKALSRQKAHHRVHGPGCQFRGTHFALYFLSKASEGWKPQVRP